MALTYQPSPVPHVDGNQALQSYLTRELQAIAIQLRQMNQVRLLVAKLSPAPMVLTAIYQKILTVPVQGENVDRTSEVGWVSFDGLFDLLGSNATAVFSLAWSDRLVTDPALVTPLFDFKVGNREVPLTIPLSVLVENGLTLWAKGLNVTISEALFQFSPMTPGGN